MKAVRLSIKILLALAFCTASAHPQGAVKLTSPPELLPGVAAFPEIVSPDTNQKKINADLRKLNRWVRSQGCTGESESGHEMFWERKVTVISQGPRFLGIRVDDSLDCGGMHPYLEQYALCYDLKTGEPVHWLQYLRGGMGREVKWSSGTSDPAKVIDIRSRLLRKLYNDKSANGLSETGEFAIYPAPEHRGLALFPVSVPAAIQGACLPLYLGEAEMAELGVPKDIRAVLLGSKE